MLKEKKTGAFHQIQIEINPHFIETSRGTNGFNSYTNN